MGQRRAERESNPRSDPTPGAVAPKKPRVLSQIAASSIGGFPKVPPSPSGLAHPNPDWEIEAQREGTLPKS